MNISQTKNLDKTFTSIDLGTMSKAEGNRLAEKLNGETYMAFKILICPANGEFSVSAETNYDGSEDEILGMFLSLMASKLAQFK